MFVDNIVFLLPHVGPDDPDDVSDSGSEDLDYFADQPLDNDSEAAISDNPHYEDFFDAPDSFDKDKGSKIGGNKEKGNESVSHDDDDDDISASVDGDNGEGVNSEDGEGGGGGDDGDIGETVSGDDSDIGEGDSDLDMDVDEEMVSNLKKEFDGGSASVSEEIKREELSTHEKKQTKVRVYMYNMYSMCIIILMSIY